MLTTLGYNKVVHSALLVIITIRSIGLNFEYT